MTTDQPLSSGSPQVSALDVEVDGGVARAATLGPEPPLIPLVASPLPAKSAPKPSLKRVALNGAAWTMGERVISQGLRLVNSMVLSRLLFPGAFGISATVNVFQSALSMLTDLGTGQSIIQNKLGGTPRFLNTAWTLQIIRGIVLSILAAVLSRPMAIWWFKKPELAPMLAVTSLTLLIQGFRSPRDSLAMKNMALRPIAVRNLGSQFITLFVTVLLVLYWRRDPWALVIGGVFGVLASTILSYVALPGPPARLCWDREAARQLSRFGRWIFLSTLLMFLASQGDRFLMGRYLSKDAFGLYNIGFVICAIPALSIQMIGPRVVFPAFSKVASQNPTRMPEVYHRLTRLMYLTALPAIGLLIGAGPLIVKIMYDPRYESAGWMVQLLAIRAATDCLISPSSSAMLALGHPRFTAITRAIQAVTVIVGIPLGFHAFGIVGAIAITAFSGIGPLFALQIGLSRHGLYRPSREALGVMGIAVGGGVGWLIAQAINPWIA